MSVMGSRGALALAAAMCAFAAGPAAADAIDGDWCDGRGKHLTIEGPSILTPGGTKMTGDYDRHGFRYVIPADEPEAGKRAVMMLLDEETMSLAIVDAAAAAIAADVPIETWRRCKLTT